MKDIKVLGIDLAKTVFQLHGTDRRGKCLLKKRLGREELKEFMVQLKPCLIGMEACSGAHYWARLFESMGHTVKMMSPRLVKPYIQSNKNDRNDARGIAEAVARPDMKFVAIKTRDQQDVLLLHRARELWIKQRTAQSNQIRGLLADYGIIFPKGIRPMRKFCEVLEQHQEELSLLAQKLFNDLYEQFKQYDEQVKHCDQQIETLAKRNPLNQELMKIDGIGVITANALVATIGDAKVFKRGRELSAWLGLVPRQYSSGNTIRLGGITKHGDRYLRKLLIHGARSVVKVCEKKTDGRSLWVADKKRRCGFNKAAVALANKNARIVWSVLSNGTCYDPNFSKKAA